MLSFLTFGVSQSDRSILSRLSSDVCMISCIETILVISSYRLFWTGIISFVGDFADKGSTVGFSSSLAVSSKLI